MKKLTFLFAIIIASTNIGIGQDMFISTQLTFDNAQEGFPSWSPDGQQIVYSFISQDDTLGKNGLWIVSSTGVKIKQLFSGIAEHPQWSPDGKFIVFDSDHGNSINMIPAKGGNPISIIHDSIQIKFGGTPCWSPDGTQIAFLEWGTMTLCVADIKTSEITRIFRGNEMIPMPGCWSKDGKYILLTLNDRQTRKSTLWKISSDGNERKQITEHHEGIYRYLTQSPDGSLLVYSAIDDRDIGIWVMPVDGGNSIKLVSTPGYNENANWSPDGKRIAYTSTRSGNFDLWVMEVDIEQIKRELSVINN